MIWKQLHPLHIPYSLYILCQTRQMVLSVCKAGNHHMAEPQGNLHGLDRVQKFLIGIHGPAGDSLIPFWRIMLHIQKHQIRIFEDLPITAAAHSRRIQAGMDPTAFTQGKDLCQKFLL